MRPLPSLRFDLVKHEKLLFVRVEGVLDEDNGLAERLTRVTDTNILLHLAKVERVNSFGARDWIRWVSALESRKNRLHFLQCSPAVISQVNLVHNFCGSQGHVLSFLAPYFCPSCQQERLEVLSVSTVGVTQEAPACACETCGERLQFDHLPGAYFDFTHIHARKIAAPEVQSALFAFTHAPLVTHVAQLQELSSGIGFRARVRESPADPPTLPSADVLVRPPTARRAGL